MSYETKYNPLLPFFMQEIKEQLHAEFGLIWTDILILSAIKGYYETLRTSSRSPDVVELVPMDNAWVYKRVKWLIEKGLIRKDDQGWLGLTDTGFMLMLGIGSNYTTFFNRIKNTVDYKYVDTL